MTDEPKRRKIIDPAVAALMSHQEERQVEARQPKAERVKRSRERKKAADRLPGRVNLDLPPELKKRLFDLAKTEGIPASQIAAFFLAEGLRRLQSGDLSFTPYRRRSDSPRYEWNLDLEEKKPK